MTKHENYDESEIMSLAVAALTTEDSANSEELYNTIVLKVIKAFSNNQKEVASELQRLSKGVETARSTEDSLTFKQRTCESMMKISMAERRKGKPVPTINAPPKNELPLNSLDYLYIGCNDFELDVRFYRDTLNGQLVWAFDKSGVKIAAFKLAYGPVILLTDHKKAPSIEPVFSVSNLENTVAILKEKGVKEVSGPIKTFNKAAYSFQDSNGNQFTVSQTGTFDTLERAYADRSDQTAIRFT